MMLSPFSRRVQDQLVSAAALGDERTQQIAGVIATAAEAAVRMTVLDALAAASTEITAALNDAAGPDAAPRAVTVQLDGDDARFVIAAPPVEPAETPAAKTDDGDASARISLRLSESLKAEIERAAAQQDSSVNSWLVRAATAALRGATSTPAWDLQGGSRGAHRITGWISS